MRAYVVRRIPLIVSGVMIYCSSLYSQSLSAGSINSIKKSTVFVQVTHTFPLTGEDVPTSGTGFFVSPHGHVITNYHVIEPVLSVYGLRFPSPHTTINVIQNSGSTDHKKMNATVCAVDKENDLAILRISDTAATPFLAVACRDEISETLPVWVFGYPFGEEFTILQRGPEITVGKGSISALRHDDRGKLTKIQIDAAINPGNSGGPVVNDKGALLGIVKLAYGTSRINFMVPCHFVSSLIDSQTFDAPGDDSAVLMITVNPPSASVFLDWQYQKTGSTITTHPGLHHVSFMHHGYESWMTERTIETQQELSVTLPPVKRLPISSVGRHLKDKQISSVACDTGTLLYSEDFDDHKVFEQWVQYTGGTDKRTWFMEKSALHQFESDQVLHAIYLGDSTWDNYIVKAKVKITDEHDDSRAGIIFRETSDGFYLFRIHKETDKAQLAYHCKRPFGWFVLMEKKLKQDISDIWYTMSVSVVENVVTCFLDSLPVFAVQSEHAKQGRIGFYSVESKASFDSLRVYQAASTAAQRLQPYNPQLLSFWFTDNFTLQSTWWYQYSDHGTRPKPWIFSDGGCVLLPEDTKTHYTEFTKYLLADFTMNLVISLGKDTANRGSFEIFLRKDSTCCIAIQFSQKDKKCRVVAINERKTKVVKKSSLPVDFFNNTMQLSLIANKEKIICRTAKRMVIECSNKIIRKKPGTFGFAASSVPVVLHQMNVTSVRDEALSAKGKKKQKK